MYKLYICHHHSIFMSVKIAKKFCHYFDFQETFQWVLFLQQKNWTSQISFVVFIQIISSCTITQQTATATIKNQWDQLMDWRTGQICGINNGNDINKIPSVVFSNSLVWTSRSPSWLSLSHYLCILWKCAEIGSFSEITLFRTAYGWNLWSNCFISTTQSIFLVFMVSDEQCWV